MAGVPDVDRRHHRPGRQRAAHRRHRRPGRGRPGRAHRGRRRRRSCRRRSGARRWARSPSTAAARTWCCASATHRRRSTGRGAAAATAGRRRSRWATSPTVTQVDGPAAGHPDRRRAQRHGHRHGDRRRTSAPPRQDAAEAAGRARRCRPARRYTIGGVSADQADAFGDLGLARAGRDRDRVPDHGGDVPQPDPAADPAGLDPVRGDRRDRPAAGHRHRRSACRR